MSETITKRSASSFDATRDESLSLSEKQTCSNSEGETASFWLIIGIIPSSKSLDRVFLRLKYFFLLAKSSSTRRICATLTEYFAKPSCQIDIKICCPTDAAACFKTVLWLVSTFNFFAPKPTAPEVTIKTSFPCFLKFAMSSMKEYKRLREISPLSFLKIFVPNLKTILLASFII